MSRVGKMPVTIPAGVDVSIKDDQISVKGAGGTLQLAGNALVDVVLDAGVMKFAPANESREANAMSGTMRQLVNNMVIGVSKGFEKKLSLVGVGLQGSGPGFQTEPERRLFASGQQRNARRHHGPDRVADGNSDQGRRPPARWPGGCRDSCHSSPGALQGQGHPLCG
jgi:hypothetical protein